MGRRVGAKAKQNSGAAAVLLLLVATTTPAIGADRTATRSAPLPAESIVAGAGTPDGSISQASARPAGGPLLRLGLSDAVVTRLRAGYRFAVRRLESSEPCRHLFAGLGVDPLPLLNQLFYYPAGSNQNNSSCRVRASAYTEVGSHVTWVCDSFALLRERQAAMVILHEALHAAGLPEQPRVPGAMTSAEINAMVAARCAL